MDANQLQQLATNARLNHWPPHLGVRTEAEKVEYLANALDEVTLRDAQIEALETQVETLEEELADREGKLDTGNDRIETLEDEIETLRDRVIKLEAAAEEPNV